jgi:hypothetical protein
VLDRVERRRLLEQPARKHPLPLLVRLLDVELDERPGQFLFLPRGGRFAGAEADDRILPAHRLAGVQRYRLHDPVTLVEDAQQRDPLRHRRDPALALGGGWRLPRRRQRDAVLLAALAAGGKRQRDQHGCGGRPHDYSGIQGS